jgi:small subunit ribosomal protein S6
MITVVTRPQTGFPPPALGLGQSRGKEVFRPVRNYELMYIVHPELEDDDQTAVKERVAGLIERGGGKVAKTEPWGLRRLAYPIRDQWEGQYVLLHLELEPQSVAELEHDIRLIEPVMRHLIVRAE